MKVILYIATSIDGYAARTDGDSDWVSDTGVFEKTIEEAGALVVGRKTFEQYEGELYPIENVLNMVQSRSSENFDGATTVNKPQDAIELAAKNGASALVVVGGPETWESFEQESLCDELIIDTEHILLGDGMKIQGLDKLELKLKSSEILDNQVIHSVYEVVK